MRRWSKPIQHSTIWRDSRRTCGRGIWCGGRIGTGAAGGGAAGAIVVGALGAGAGGIVGQAIADSVCPVTA